MISTKFDPYTGDPHPDGAFGAVAVGGGRVEMDIPPGADVSCTFRVRGKPAAAGWAQMGGRGHRKWHLPDLEVTIWPLDDATPRLQAVRPRRDWLRIKIRRRGYSEKTFAWFTAPAPGGRYWAQVTGPVEDPEAHVLISGPH